jgi:hypothetical protein
MIINILPHIHVWRDLKLWLRLAMRKYSIRITAQWCEPVLNLIRNDKLPFLYNTHPDIHYWQITFTYITISAYNWCSVCLYLQLFVRWLVFYLRYLCVSANIVVHFVGFFSSSWVLCTQPCQPNHCTMMWTSFEFNPQWQITILIQYTSGKHYF